MVPCLSLSMESGRGYAETKHQPSTPCHLSSDKPIWPMIRGFAYPGKLDLDILYLAHISYKCDRSVKRRMLECCADESSSTGTAAYGGRKSYSCSKFVFHGIIPLTRMHWQLWHTSNFIWAPLSYIQLCPLHLRQPVYILSHAFRRECSEYRHNIFGGLS